MDPRKALEELAKRKAGGFNVEDACFDKQIEFIKDPSKLKTVVSGRRSGKTYACGAYLIHAALTNPKSKVVFMAITKDYAKSLIWNVLVDLNFAFNLNLHFVETDGKVLFNNGAEIMVTGADNSGEVRKVRGHAISLAIIDEVQNFRPHVLEDLIDNVLSKALYDYDGTLILSGTPGPVEVGYFYDCDKGKKSKAFTHYKWTMFENPHLKKKSGRTAQYLLDQDMKRMGVTIEHPIIRREIFAEWITDSDSLVFKYAASINDYRDAPPLTDYVIGVDLGFDDADAIAVLGWSADSPSIYLVEEVVTRGQTLTDLAAQLSTVIDKYNPLRIVMDTGGLGKKLAEELRKRYALPIQAAEKVRKFEYIELLNDALRTARFKAPEASQFAQDCMLVEWDRTNPNKLAIKDAFHSDITDAVLYAYREALHWLFLPKAPTIDKHTPEWYAQIERTLEEEAEKRLSQHQSEETPDSDPWGAGLMPSDE